MKAVSAVFRHDDLLVSVRAFFAAGLKRFKVPDLKRQDFSTLDCLMAGLAVFTFKYPSLLQFDHAVKSHGTLLHNLKTLFWVPAVPSDTQMRTRLDEIDPSALRPAFAGIFRLLQRSKLLDSFRFLGDHYLVSLDGTGVFSSHTVHCDQCCVKTHRSGAVTYYHQILAAALVHPDQRVVFPLVPEPIMKEDGSQKNDCERNAAKRWIADFRREHPHLKTVILADGLSANEPFIKTLTDHRVHFILVCKETDHTYLTDWVQGATSEDTVSLRRTDPETGTIQTYDYMQDVPLNDAKHTCRVGVMRFSETVKNKTTHWMWVTDLPLEKQDFVPFVKGARSRWKIENETFNTLKNQGYGFDHNYGHGHKNLSVVFSYLMMIAFLIDQCLQKVNRFFEGALKKAGTKKGLWQSMVFAVKWMDMPNFETLYHTIADPPTFKIQSVL